MSEQIETIKSLIREMAERVNAGQLPDVVDEYFSDAVIAPPGAEPIIVDPKSFRDEYEAAKDLLRSEWVLKSFKDVHISGDIALVRTSADWIDHNLVEKTKTVHDRENIIILQRKNSSWKVLLETFIDHSVKQE